VGCGDASLLVGAEFKVVVDKSIRLARNSNPLVKVASPQNLPDFGSRQSARLVRPVQSSLLPHPIPKPGPFRQNMPIESNPAICSGL